MYKERTSYDSELLIYALLSCFFTIVNSLFILNTRVSVAFAVLETLILLYFLIFKNVDKFILCFLLLISSVIESNIFAFGDSTKVIYSFVNLPIIHYYHLFFILLIAYIKFHFRGTQKGYINIKSFSSKMLILFVIECGTTSITLLLNDNGVLTLDGLLRFVIIDCYNTYWTCIVFAILWDCLARDHTFESHFKAMLIGILSGASLASIFLVVMGNINIVNNEVINLISPLSLFFAPGLLICYFSERKVGLLLLGGITSIIQMRYSLGLPGAWWLFLAAVVMVFIFRMFKGIKRRMHVHQVIMYISIIIIANTIIIYIASQGITIKLRNSYISYKLSTVFNLFTFRQDFHRWYLGLGASIGVRLEELINILLEFAEKPWYLLFGKGYGGSVIKHWGINNWNIVGSTFPDMMIKNGVYMLFHTGTAELLINFGLFGLYLNFIVLKICIREIFRTDACGWIVIGAVWMITVLYSYRSMTIGLASLCYGVYLWRKKELLGKEIL